MINNYNANRRKGNRVCRFIKRENLEVSNMNNFNDNAIKHKKMQRIE